MKRTWFSFVVVFGILGLLTLFLGLQYGWLSKAGEAERDRMQKRVETDTARLAEDFNREMQAAYYNFQTHSGLWKNSAWPEFNERYAFWKERTAYPELIRDIYFVGKDPNILPLRYDVTQQTFEPSQLTEPLNNLRVQFADDSSFRPVYEDEFAMVVPVYEGEREFDHIILKRSSGVGTPMPRMPEKFGWVVILLDESIVRNKILPDLSAKYFGDGEYSVSVFNKGGQAVFSSRTETTESDATKLLFDLSPDNFVFFANRDAMPKVIETRKNQNGVVIDQRVESHSFSRTESVTGKSGTFTVELKEHSDSPKVRTSVIAATDRGRGPWTLQVRHVAGSIDSFVRGQRQESFLIGLGIYVLLVGAIMATILSAMRSKRFAQRQIDFVSSVSHEFRTPLAVIYSAGENLADGIAKENEQVSRYGALIKNEGKKLSGMVEQILEFAGANSGRQKYNFAPANVDDIVHDAIAECRPLIESGSFEIETDLRSGLPEIHVDRGALSSALQNLIANAAKYSNGSKWIKLSAVNGGRSVKISVEDRGIGIRGDDLRRIFEPFYRAKEVVDAQISGNGLGLNLVKKIAEAHGGKVAVESQPGVGSKFTIELPQS